MFPTVNMSFNVARAICVTRKIDSGFFALGVGCGLIGHDERVLGILVLKVVENTLLFHQSRNKFEIGLAILYAILALGCVPAIIEVSKSVKPKSLNIFSMISITVIS